jgi:NADH-quinone oxidoreductase subunit E
VKQGETTSDGRFSLETVNCLGACALGPLVVVDEDYHGNMTVDGVKKVLKKYESGE